MGNAFINSLAITLPATFIPILIAAFAAYAFTFMEFWGRDFLFLTIVSLLVVPNYVAFVPMLKIYANLEMNGTFPAVWLAHIGFGMSLAIYILRNYMATLPKTVIESAKIDGASHFQTFFKLILPMSVPALASFAIFQFLWVWNDLLVALVFIGPGTNEPVTVGPRRSPHQRRPGLGAHHRRRLHRHHPADHRVPGDAAVLRPRHDGGRRQGLSGRHARTSETPGQPRCPGVLLDPPSSPNSWGGLSHAVPARSRRRPAHRRRPRRRRRGAARGLVARCDRPQATDADGFGVVANGPGLPLLGEHARGRFTRPHLRGHRVGGGAWTTWFRPTGQEVDDTRARASEPRTRPPAWRWSTSWRRSPAAACAAGPP